jgi:chaperone required for assembly of F1-ATPase
VTKRIRTAGTAPGPDGTTAVLLDGKPAMTPAGRPLAVPTAALAEAVAAEFRAQGERVSPASMPMTQFAATAIDRIAPHREAVVDAVAAYAETDLLCYRADEPAELAERQARAWQPLLDWAAHRYDAALHVHSGIMPRPQPADAVAALRRAAAGLDDFRLSALQAACGTLGSLVLALALAEGRIGAAEAFEAAELDATFQIEKWGEDPEAARRRAGVRADAEAAEAFLRLLAA